MSLDNFINWSANKDFIPRIYSEKEVCINEGGIICPRLLTMLHTRSLIFTAPHASAAQLAMILTSVCLLSPEATRQKVKSNNKNNKKQ